MAHRNQGMDSPAVGTVRPLAPELPFERVVGFCRQAVQQAVQAPELPEHLPVVRVNHLLRRSLHPRGQPSDTGRKIVFPLHLVENLENIAGQIQFKQHIIGGGAGQVEKQIPVALLYFTGENSMAAALAGPIDPAGIDLHPLVHQLVVKNAVAAVLLAQGTVGTGGGLPAERPVAQLTHFEGGKHLPERMIKVDDPVMIVHNVDSGISALTVEFHKALISIHGI